MKKLMTLGIVLASFCLMQGTMLYAKSEKKPTPVAVTVTDKDLAPELFDLKVAYMTGDELFVEADAWLKILQEASKKVYDEKLQIKLMTKKISEVHDNNSSEENLTLLEKENDALIESLVELREKRRDVEKKLDLILQEINERIGLDENGHEKEKVLHYRRYLDSVGGMAKEITSAKTFMSTIKEWLTSQQGGLLWLMDFLKFTGILVLAYFIAKILSSGVSKALALSKNPSQLLNEFIVNVVKKTIMFLGLLVGLSVLGINMGPVLAFVGAAGFVIAFALQNTLSNFASGMMIMLYRPFDIDDVVDVAGVVGSVKSMTLVTTSIMTADNRMMIIPNNTIWGSIITNVTHSDKRRVDLTVGVGYDEDIEKTERVLRDILSKHPLILKEPEPAIQVHELADSSVNFIVRPWTMTSDYWTVYWEITRRIKIRFDEEGITIPYPQTDVHIVTSVETEHISQRKKEFTKEKAKTIDVTKMDSSDDD